MAATKALKENIIDVLVTAPIKQIQYSIGRIQISWSYRLFRQRIIWKRINAYGSRQPASRLAHRPCPRK